MGRKKRIFTETFKVMTFENFCHCLFEKPSKRERYCNIYVVRTDKRVKKLQLTQNCFGDFDVERKKLNSIENDQRI